MDGSAAETVQAIIAFLGDVGPEHQGATKGNTIPLEWFRWLSADAVQLFYEPLTDADGNVVPASAGTQRSAVVDREYGERLAALDQLRTTHRTLRAGWLFVAGRRRTDEGHRAIFRPLVTAPV